MKILIATGVYPPDTGGPATYTKMLEVQLPKYDIDFVVVPYGWVRRYPKVFRHVVYTWKLFRESNGCDMLYALDPVSVGLPVYLVGKITGKKYMLRVPGDYAWEQGQQRFGVTETLDKFLVSQKKHSIFVRALKKIQKTVANGAEHVVVPSKYMKSVVAAWSVNAKKITSIYSALHPIEVQEKKQTIRTMFQYEGTVLVTAARLVPWKGISTLISILPSLRGAIGEVTLIVIGEGPLENELKQQVSALELGESVRIVGRLDRSALAPAVLGADMFVLNTSYEGMSHHLLEAMASGVPIVTTHVGGNPELITDGVNGLLVPYDHKEELISAITRLATHETFREQVVQNARVRVRDFSEDTVIKELVTLLKSIS